MIDYYWLKSFTEIMQLFLSVLFLVYLKIKYPRAGGPILWLSVFFYIKLATDLYGILNYTSWISTILTLPVLSVYRSAMGMFEVGMITSFLLFAGALSGKEIPMRKAWLYFIPALLLFPFNWSIQYFYESTLLEMFNLIKTVWIISMIYALRQLIREKHLAVFALSMLAWNVLWLAEVLLHQQYGLISEELSWIIFVIAEFSVTIGTAYFLLQVIGRPRLLRFEKISDLFSENLRKTIKAGLEKAFEEDKIYLETELTLPELSNRINIPATELTNYLNRVIGKNFNQFVIDYRIEESKRLLRESSDLSIEQVMLKAGFNSKSVFNTAFKRKTAITPSEYRIKV